LELPPAQAAGLIALTRTGQVRGAVEHFPLDDRLRSLARRQPDCGALMRHYGSAS
jgi:hypothetical protein